MIWDPAEQLSRKDLRELQLSRLRATFGLDVSSLDEVASLPFATKSTLRDAYPFGLLRVPVESLARLHASSGTYGKPTVVGYTPADLEVWTELMARSMTMAGVRPGMPDLHLPVDGSGWALSLYLETKVLKHGRLSRAQKEVHAHLRALGNRVEVVFTSFEAFRIMAEHLAAPLTLPERPILIGGAEEPSEYRVPVKRAHTRKEGV